jgi:hypothetical protein
MTVSIMLFSVQSTVKSTCFSSCDSQFGLTEWLGINKDLRHESCIPCLYAWGVVKLERRAISKYKRDNMHQDKYSSKTIPNSALIVPVAQC